MTSTDTKAGRLRQWALEALVRHADDGTVPTSARHLFYEAVMAGIITKGDPNKTGGGRRSDQDLNDALVWLRERGIVPWTWLEDRTRHFLDYRGHGTTMAEAFVNVLDSVRVDPWDDVLPVLVVESESGAGVLVATASHYRVPVVPTRGQTNGWLRTTVTELLEGRTIAVGYVGDADKAGLDIELNTARVLGDVCDIKSWERLALTWDQVDEHGLPTVERHDRRDGRTRLVCELEALPQQLLVATVTAWLDDQLGQELDDVHERERRGRADLRALLASD